MGGEARFGRSRRALRRAVLRPVDDVIAALDRTVAGTRSPWPALGALVAGTAVSWFAYVPVHELLHVAGCIATGGEVRQVTIDPVYGGSLLASWFPVITAGGEYAGRLTDFRTGRSDLTYLSTDAAPFLLSVLGVPLLRIATKRRSAAFAGLALVLALGPFISLTGDYYEMGSILVTRMPALLEAPPEPYSGAAGIMALRSDDLPALISAVWSSPGSFTAEVPGGLPSVLALIAASTLAGTVLAFGTYGAGDLLARRLGLGPSSQASPEIGDA